MKNGYEDFLKTKIIGVNEVGFEIDESAVHSMLFPFQRDIVIWAIRLGRAAIFADCGLGKSFMQLEWARIVAQKTGKPVLLVAPLGVTGQTIQEAKKLGIDLNYCRSQSDADGVTNDITNYEMLAKFNPRHYSGMVIDESSILKNYTGKTKKLIIEMAQSVEYRLACTATPAPNDHLELGNHAEFLGIMRSREMIQRWFVNDSMHAGGYRLRKHGANDFWRWVASWAVSIQKPSDIGIEYSDEGYILPALNFVGHVVPVDHSRAWQEVGKNGQASLLLVNNTSATGMHKEKRATLKKRMKQAADTVKAIQVKNSDEFIIVWCEYNYEADELTKLLPDAIEIRGNEKLEIKQQKLLDFSNGKYQVLITKPKIAAHGLNWQHAGSQVWVSINHKFEQFYQGYKRSHRFGRKLPVDCHIVFAESEGGILSNLQRKHGEHELMQHEMVRAMRENGMSVKVDRRLSLVSDWGEYECGDGWKLYHGDSAQTWQNEPDESVHFFVQSPPFKSLYIYSSNIEDLGNCATDAQFYYQYQFILREELRLLKPGSYKAEHCKDLPLYQNRDGAMGLQDFPGELIKAHIEAGFEFVDWITIWKDPVVEMQRTKNAGLLWSSAFCERAERARQGMADYTLIFRKPDDQPVETKMQHTELPESVANRCVDLWSNPGENIQSPFHKIRNGELIDLMIVDDSSKVMPQIDSIIHWLRPGRNLVVNIDNPLVMMDLINDVMPHGLVFHSRVALTNGNWLLVFRRWVDEMTEDKNPDIIHVKHDLVASEHEFIGNDGPEFWDSDRDYSIQVWQRYASPVWFDLDGLPDGHKNIWFDINQTNVLNHRIARDDGDEKHICPLQIDLIERCIKLYTEKGQRVGSSFVGVGSEMATAIEMGREARGSELKRSYYELACDHLRQAVVKVKRPSLFDFAGIKVTS